MAKKQNAIYVEPHANGYAVERPNAKRVSAVEPTQQKAIERAQEIAPTAAVHVARVRHTDKGHPDQYRKL